MSATATFNPHKEHGLLVLEVSAEQRAAAASRFAGMIFHREQGGRHYIGSWTMGFLRAALVFLNTLPTP